MRAFMVDRKTRGLLLTRVDSFEWQLRQYVTQRDNMFFIEEMVLDATGIHDPEDLQGVMKEAAGLAVLGLIKHGLDPMQHYAFYRDGHVLVVHHQTVRLDVS